ncbi:MAG: MFS transporter [Dehalococcoidia bacterium]
MFYGWWIVFSSAGIIFLTGGTFFYGFGTLVTPLSNTFGWSRAAISGAFSLRTELGGVEAAAIGYLVDRIGSRRLLVAGVFLVGLGFVLLSFIQAIWQLYVVVAIIALGMGATGGAVPMVAIAHWFHKKRGRALAFMTMGAGTSGVMVVVLATLIDFTDWRTALLVMGLTQWAICFPLALIVRDRPQDMGLLPDGEPAPTPAAQPVAADQGQPPATDPEHPSKAVISPQDEGFTVGQALRTRCFWFVAIAMSLVGFGSQAVIVHQIPFMEDSLHLTTQSASLVAMAMPIVSLAGRLGFGWLADYVDKRKVLAASYFCIGAGVLLFSVVHSSWQILLYLAIFGPGWGGSIAVRPAFQADYFGLRAFGSIQGLMFFVASAGSFFGPIFAGGVYDLVDSYRPGLQIVGLAALLAVPIVLAAGKPLAQPAEAAGAPQA